MLAVSQGTGGKPAHVSEPPQLGAGVVQKYGIPIPECRNILKNFDFDISTEYNLGVLSRRSRAMHAGLKKLCQTGVGVHLDVQQELRAQNKSRRLSPVKLVEVLPDCDGAGVGRWRLLDRPY